MTDTIPFTDAKAHLSELVDRVSREHERVIVTRNGRAAAILMSPEELESLEETIAILQDRELLASIRRSRQEATAGKRVKLRDEL